MQGPSGDFYETFCEESHFKYYFYVPNNLSSIVFDLEMDEQLTILLIQAHRELGILEGMTKCILPIEHFEDMIIRSEACHSCIVDSIVGSYDGVLKKEKRNIDDCAALNCYEAIKYFKGKLFTAELISGLHEKIMQGIADDTVGIFRDKPFFMHPDYIVNIREYNPPSPQFVQELIDDLVDFIRKDNTMDVLIKAALAYYQFETIHPFASGNGRVGRILPMVILLENEILSQPMLPMSSYLFKNNRECLTRFKHVQLGGDYVEWIKFFIQGVIETSKKVISQLEQVIQLREENIQKINAIPKQTKLLLAIYNYVEQTPIINIKEISEHFQIAYNTAAKSIDMLVDIGILHLKNQKSRYREFSYEQYIEVFDSLRGTE